MKPSLIVRSPVSAAALEWATRRHEAAPARGPRRTAGPSDLMGYGRKR